VRLNAVNFLEQVHCLNEGRILSPYSCGDYEELVLSSEM
jgi:hypothetical protein